MGGGGDFTNAVVKIKPDGSADLITGTVELGQGSGTVLPMMVAEVLGIPYEKVRYSTRTLTAPRSASAPSPAG